MKVHDKLIVIEGLDAAGKNTQAKKLAERLTADGCEAVVFSFPRYETMVGKAIKRHLVGDVLLSEKMTAPRGVPTPGARAPEDALTFQCMMLADKYDAAADIESHLKAGRVVICDRWWQSALCFGAADGLNRAWLIRIHEHLPKVDFNIYIDVPPEEALKRRPEARDRYEKDREKQKAVRANYGALWASNHPDTWVIVDGRNTIEAVHADIWGLVKP